jgi:hypothetical protein
MSIPSVDVDCNGVAVLLLDPDAALLRRCSGCWLFLVLYIVILDHLLLPSMTLAGWQSRSATPTTSGAATCDGVVAVYWW